jgi:hypothetical protein
VRLWPIEKFDPEKDLVTPSEETLAPMLTGLANFKPGAQPPVADGVKLSRKGVTVTALGPNPDGAGTLLRLWELAGNSGDVTVALPPTLRVSSAQPMNLRGEPEGAAVTVLNGGFGFKLGAFAPASFRLE